MVAEWYWALSDGGFWNCGAEPLSFATRKLVILF